MKVQIASACILWSFASVCFAQHAGDVEFGYDVPTAPTGFIIETDQFTSDGRMFFESEFEELDPFNLGDFSSDEPGFTTNLGEGLRVNPQDQVWLNAVDASSNSAFGVGYVNFYNPTNDSFTAAGRLAIEDNSGATANLVLNGASIESGPSNQFIGLGSNAVPPNDPGGDVHDHLIIDLLDDATAPLGAYGVMFQLQSDFAPADGTMNLSSDPFWIIWNHGMSEADFEARALPNFGVAAVPEPASLGTLMLVACGATLRRRRR